MKETTPAAMPSCFDKWCQRFDEAFTHKAQKNRKITISVSENLQQTIRLDELAQSLPS